MKNGTAFFGLIIFIALQLIPQNGWGQKMLNNRLSVEFNGSKKYMGSGATYSRALSSQFSLLSSVNTGRWKSDINSLNRGELKGTAYSFGLGTEWHPASNGKGFFIQGLASYQRMDIQAKGRLESDDELDANSHLWTAILFGLLDSDYDTYSHTETRKGLTFSGKLGYRLTGKKEKIYIAPYIAMQSRPFQNKELVLDSNSTDNLVRINPAAEMGKGSTTFGIEMGVRF